MVTFTRALALVIALLSFVSLIRGAGIAECIYLLLMAFFVLYFDNSVRRLL